MSPISKGLPSPFAPAPSGRRFAIVRLGRAAAAAAIGLGGLAAGAAGQDPGPLVTDRPDQTESAESVPRGVTQLEVGTTWTRLGGEGDPSALTLGATLARLGLGGGLEARIGHEGWTSLRAGGETIASGLGDAEVGAKLAGPVGAGSLGVLASAWLPTGEEGLGHLRADPSLRALYARPLGGRLSAGANLGLAVESGPDPDPDADPDAVRSDLGLPWSAVLGVGATERVGLFVELYGSFGLTGEAVASQSLDGGLTVLVLDALQLDASAGVGLDDDAEDWFVGGGVSVRIPR